MAYTINILSSVALESTFLKQFPSDHTVHSSSSGFIAAGYLWANFLPESSLMNPFPHQSQPQHNIYISSVKSNHPFLMVRMNATAQLNIVKMIDVLRASVPPVRKVWRSPIFVFQGLDPSSKCMGHRSCSLSYSTIFIATAEPPPVPCTVWCRLQNGPTLWDIKILFRSARW